MNMKQSFARAPQLGAEMQEQRVHHSSTDSRLWGHGHISNKDHSWGNSVISPHGTVCFWHLKDKLELNICGGFSLLRS